MIPFGELRRGDFYIVGAMSGHERWNWDEFRLVKREMRDDPMTPHDREAMRDGYFRVSDWLKTAGRVGVADDLRGFSESIAYILDNRPALIAIRGWRKSEGTLAEVAVARRLRLPVYEVVYEGGTPVGVIPLGETVRLVVQTKVEPHETQRTLVRL